MSRIRLRVIGVGLVALVGVGMTGCGNVDGSGGTESDTPATTVPASDAPTAVLPSTTPSSATLIDAMEGISVTWGAGVIPDITFAQTPFTVKSTTWQILSEGTGGVVPPDATVLVHYHGVNGRTGEIFDSSYQHQSPAEFGLDGVISGFAKAISGQKVGTTLVVAIAGVDGYDATGGVPQAGIEIGDTLVFLIEILEMDGE